MHKQQINYFVAGRTSSGSGVFQLAIQWLNWSDWDNSRKSLILSASQIRQLGTISRGRNDAITSLDKNTDCCEQ
jgi:hypothetical protein